MREAIINCLINQIPEIGDRCFDPHAAGKDTEKPYFVVRFGTESEDTPWTGFRRIIEVWPNVSRTSFISVDDLEKKAIAALDKQLLSTASGEAFTCVYLGNAGPDALDDDFDIITRGLRFAILALQPLPVTETAPDDPWLMSLSDWTGNLLGEDWHIYQSAWPVGYRRPAVLWRVGRVRVKSLNAALFEVQKDIVGHVLGRTPNEQFAAAVLIAQELGSAVKIIHDADNRRYLTVSNPSVDYRTTDVLKNGQISVTLSRLTNKPIEDTPTIGTIIIKGEVN